MPSSFEAMHEETRPLALLDEGRGRGSRPSRSEGAVKRRRARLAGIAPAVIGGLTGLLVLLATPLARRIGASILWIHHGQARR
jgi:hypothetical protein